MKTRILVTEGKMCFRETHWNKPEPLDDQIEVMSVITGVCRSDIDMMSGSFGPLPLEMQGHEGLGVVTKIGKEVKYPVNIGDFVATRGEPAYSDFYNVREKEFVRVPNTHPRYIVEPVACGINIVNQSLQEISQRSGPGRRILILGSGFLAWVVYNTLLLNHLDFEFTVIGNSNQELWGQRLSRYYGGKFDVVIDLGSRDDVYTKDILHPEALVIFGAQKEIKTDFRHLLWNACTMVFPSPRNNKFHDCMEEAVRRIRAKELVVDSFWSRSYNRETEWKQAFEDGMSRPINYNRGYIQWV